MPRDVFVYTGRDRVVSMDELLSEMRARALPLAWEEQALTGDEDPDDWLAADLRPEGGAGAGVSVSFEKVDEAVIEETLEGHADVLRPRDREALRRSRARYRLVPGRSGEGERLLVNLVAVLARSGDGLVCDLGAGRFYTAGEYEAARADVLGE